VAYGLRGDRRPNVAASGGGMSAGCTAGQLFVSAGNALILRCGIMSNICHFRDCKALLGSSVKYIFAIFNPTTSSMTHFTV